MGHIRVAGIRVKYKVIVEEVEELVTEDVTIYQASIDEPVNYAPVDGFGTTIAGAIIDMLRANRDNVP